ncbi:hypothetical protein MFLO_06992 [Listeria floridensis FSL S10-1187]|uniref:Lipoprotein n=1 Tax=Listeria floridensis FSL S10-1187 TaxID=1265817 RepID=A0ABN0RG18_9LIST|nr:DUF3997 domain-containing protein [Listeria floridensis]EUJ32446.1 hypothetical protein MFLO_06992 [Listeria floridensis FSL S10-1187]
MKKILGLLVVMILILSGCAGSADYAIKVNDRYEIWQIYPTLHVIHDNENGEIQLDNHTNSSSDSSDNIVKLNWDKDFLIAKTETEEESNKWFKKHENPTYWLLDLEKNQLTGPIKSETEFKNILKEKKIDLELMSYEKRIKDEEKIY